MLDKPADKAKDHSEALKQLIKWAVVQNYAEDMDEEKLGNLGKRVVEGYEIDKESRKDWEAEAKLAMDAVLQKSAEKSHPWPKAANVKYPLLTTATLQFGARSLPAIVQGDRVVKVKVVGRDPMGMKRARAERVSLHMSYQILKQMDGWEENTDILLHQMPALGDGFKKVYWDDEDSKPCSEMISAMNVIVNQSTKSLKTVPRISHEVELYPHQIEERIRGGTYLEFDYETLGGGPLAAEPSNSTDTMHDDPERPHLFIEQHCYIDMDEDGLKEPWIVTVHKDSAKVVRVVANYDFKQAKFGKNGKLIKLPRYQYFVHFPFLPDPNGGFYGIGYGRLLRSIGDTINTVLNQMLDAATLQNKGGGFIGSGMDLKKNTLNIRMNQWTFLNIPGQNIRDAIVPHNFPGPSPVLFNLLGLMVDMGKQISNVQDVMTGDVKAQTMQPTTLLALVEQGMKVYTSILKRVFRSMGEEFQLLYRLNKRYPDEQAYQDLIDWQEPVAQLQQAAQLESQGQPIPPELEEFLTPPTMAGDYAEADCDITPIADPSAATDMQKMAKAQLQMTLAEHPMLGPTLNMSEVAKRVLEAAQIEDVEQIMAGPQAVDPKTEAMKDAEIAKKNSEAIKNAAQADKFDKEAEAKQHEIDVERAHIISGDTDADKSMARAVQASQIAKNQHDSVYDRHDMAVKTHQTLIAQQEADKPDPKPKAAA